MTELPADSVRVSVIIPVLEDAEGLQQCLTALDRQSYPGNLMEIVVVDNGSERDIRAVVDRHPSARFLSETTPSSYAARNTGLRAATGDVLAFTDADCIPDANWIRRGVARLLRADKPGLVGGRIDIFPTNANAPTAAELFEVVAGLPQKTYIERWRFAATANMFTTPRVVAAVGPFNEKLQSGGDLEWGNRVHAAGMSQAYADDAIIAHPARPTMAAVEARARRIQGGIHDIRIHQGRPLAIRLAMPFLEWPRIPDSIGMAFDPRLSGLRQRAMVFAASRRFKRARISEGVRLTLGGVSRRT